MPFRKEVLLFRARGKRRKSYRNFVNFAHGVLYRRAGGGKGGEIVLADKGPGIKDIEKAMQEGYSTAPDSVRSLGFGAGMGLPNMKRYTDYMNIESVVGEGTTITMRVNIE